MFVVLYVDMQQLTMQHTYNIQDIKYDTQIEVSKQQYDKLIVDCTGIIAHREQNGKYFIKVWYMKYKHIVLDCLIKYK